VLDLDNTLLGWRHRRYDGLAGIRLGQNSAEGVKHIAFQRYVLDLRDRGIVLAVCSKNTDEIAREPFRSHPEMILREHHVAVFQANWEDKASNVQAIAEALNLGLESLVFVDDNPAERERVRQELPLVCVPEIGSEPAAFPYLISGAGAFEHLVLNADDLGRARATRQCRAELDQGR
jgi:FkbH-like protein